MKKTIIYSGLGIIGVGCLVGFLVTTYFSQKKETGFESRDLAITSLKKTPQNHLEKGRKKHLQDLEALFKEFKNSNALRHQRLKELLSELSLEEMLSIIQWLEKNRDEIELSQEEINIAMRAWGALDTEGAMQYVAGSMIDFMNGYVAKNPNSFIPGTWEDFTHAKSAAGAVFDDWLDRDEEQAVSYWQDNYGDYLEVAETPHLFGIRFELMRRAVGKKAEEGIDVAVKWIEGLRHEKTREESTGMLLMEWSKLNPEEAVTWAEENGNYQMSFEVTVKVVQNWSKIDPKQALNWGLRQEDKELRGYAVGQAVVEWGQQDAVEMGKYLNELSDDPFMDQVVREYALYVSGEDAPASLTWANSIHDPSKREETVKEIINSWYYRAPNEAKSWIYSTDLSEEEFKKMEAQLAQLEDKN